MWYDAWLESIMDTVGTIRTFLPTIAAAALIVLTGWILARISRRWGRRLTGRLLDRLGATSSSIGGAVESSGVRETTPRVVAGFVYWFVLLVFVAAGVETLGLPLMTELLAQVAAYAPNLLAAALIALGGMITARVVRTATQRAAHAGGVPQAARVAAVAEGMVVVLAAVIALEQLGINGRVLELTVGITIGSALAAVALAFGLGARYVGAGRWHAARYVGQLLRVGQRVMVDDVRGTVIEMTPTAVVIETSEGRFVVPAQRFQDAGALILHQEA